MFVPLISNVDILTQWWCASNGAFGGVIRSQVKPHQVSAHVVKLRELPFPYTMGNAHKVSNVCKRALMETWSGF